MRASRPACTGSASISCGWSSGALDIEEQGSLSWCTTGVMLDVHGTYPFGEPRRAVVQQDRGPKRVFVLGVYASAVHARWIDADGKELVRALAVANEPTIFWDGSDAANIVARIKVPSGAGVLEPADDRMNGPSGRALDEHVLRPLVCGRADSWLCDLIPHTCLNAGQAQALEREYEPRAQSLGLPAVDLPPVPKTFGDSPRREAVLRELEESRAQLVVLLGDEPIKHWLRWFDGRWRSLAAFGDTDDRYGRRHEANIAGRRYEVLPVVHPRQAAGLGSHSPKLRARHAAWVRRTAG
jgi:hypothetical protein